MKVKLFIYNEPGRYSPISDEEQIPVLFLLSEESVEKQGTYDFNANYVRQDRGMEIRYFIWSNWHTNKGQLTQSSSDYMDDEWMVFL